MTAQQLQKLKSEIGGIKYRGGKLINELIASTLYASLDKLAAKNESDFSQIILIAGFWRSGTTWLQQSISYLIEANSFFEPFDPKIQDYRDEILPIFAPNANWKEAYHMPFSNDNLQETNPKLYQYLVKCFSGHLEGAWIRTLRNGPFDSLRPRKTVKFVRSQLCLRGIYQEFSVPVVYITRDPRAIIASTLRHNWGHFFEHPFLEKTLLQSPDQRSVFFKDWTDDIIRIDQGNTVGRIAMFWSLLETYVRQNCTDIGADICFLNYEDILEGDYSNLYSFLKHQGYGIRENTSSKNPFLVDSKMTQSSRKEISIKERKESWKKSLSLEEIKKIESIVCNFSLDQYLMN